MSPFARALRAALDRLAAREPIVMYRFGDGELALARGEAVGPATQAFRTDRWSAPAKMTRLGSVLRTVLDTREAWAHFGIPCPCCNEAGYRALKRWLTADGGARARPNLFPANLFINANYPRFLSALPRLWESGPVALIANDRAQWDRGAIVGALRVPDDGVAFYEANASRFVQDARAFAEGLPERTLVLSAAGPLSEALLFFLHETRPDLAYADVGSALDEAFYARKTRPFMTAGTEYAERECDLPEGERAGAGADSDPSASRFVLPTDPRRDTLAGVELPRHWWSRPYEYAWALAQVPTARAPSFRVLDAACGVSHPLKYALAEMEGCRADACDVDRRILDAEAILADVRADLGAAAELRVRSGGTLSIMRRLRADVTDLPYPAGSFDRVFCVSVLEHMDRGERLAALGEFRRVLAPGGQVVLTVDVPPVDPTALPALLAEAGLRFAGPVDLAEPPDALASDHYGPRLRCFRALLERA